jgi:hypothetical protein
MAESGKVDKKLHVIRNRKDVWYAECGKMDKKLHGYRKNVWYGGKWEGGQETPRDSNLFADCSPLPIDTTFAHLLYACMHGICSSSINAMIPALHMKGTVELSFRGGGGEGGRHLFCLAMRSLGCEAIHR